jgi:energy-coupling factor transport system ATP-binding protein
MRLTRLTALRAALLLAAGFVVLRVVYRIVFGGGSGGGALLLDLPRIRLAGPFEHITLFGAVTTGGVVNAAQSALPFAALVLALGLISVVVDLRAVLTRGAVRGPVRTVSRALVVAWATFPALLASVRRVRVARELRAERGAASLLVPVLEHTVERAIALGASMEVRGFAAARRVEPNCEHPAAFRGVSLGYEGRWNLEHVDLELAPGTLTLVTGATGSGKSTLLHAMSGLFQHVSDGDQAGVIEVAGVDRLAVPPRETAGFVGVVSQSVRLSFVAATVADELGFALAARNVAAVIVRTRVAELADRLGIQHLLDREIDALSAGEACLVAIGAALIEQPVLLLVDEPLADLDDAARAQVVDVLGRLAHEAGVCVVVAEHAVDDWGSHPDTRLAIENGSVRSMAATTTPTGAQSSTAAPIEEPASAAPQATTATPIAQVRHLSVSHGDRRAVDDATFTLAAGEIVALRGPNGAGKSSLLHAMARPEHRDTVLVGERDVHRMARRSRRTAVALVPEAFDDLLFATTVARECERADARASRPGTAALFARLLGLDLDDDARDMLDRHPRDLSAGERLCLVLAIQLSARPSVLLVDEPSRGLDAAARELVGSVLVEAAASGTTVVLATHDRDFADRYATRTITMTAGRLDQFAEVAQ